MSRARTKIESRNTAPEIKPLWDEFGLSDSSSSGLRYRIGSNEIALGPVAGCPRELTWPPERSMAAECIWPRSFSLPVVVDYDGEDWGGVMHWKPIMEHVSTQTIREILIEHAEREQQIQLLERHLQLHLEVA